jgi:hypothetical protein
MALHHPDLFTQLSNSTVFLDTNVFSTASKSKDFAEFIVELKNEATCAYATIPSVVFEVTNGSSNLGVYNERSSYINSTVDNVLQTSFIDRIPDFCVLMAKINGGNKSYTDFLLAACLYQYKHSKVYLMTTDLKAFPAFFERESIITTEQNSGDVINFGIYSFNETSYVKALKGASR